MDTFREILIRLSNVGYIDKSTHNRSDYDLLTLTKVIRKRKGYEKHLCVLKQKNKELDTFHQIILETDDLCYTPEELRYIYEHILS